MNCQSGLCLKCAGGSLYSAKSSSQKLNRLIISPRAISSAKPNCCRARERRRCRNLRQHTPHENRKHNQPDSAQRRTGGVRSCRLPPANRSMHWLLYVGVGMIAALALWLILSSVLAWGVGKYNDVIYGYPRYFQTDAVVGHNDSAAHPSHFIALNLHGQVIVIELPGGNPTKSFDYVGPTMIANGDDLIPITLTFSDVHHNGKPDMFIHIQDREFYFCNDGTKFVTCNAP